jgi:hypothetical protein
MQGCGKYAVVLVALCLALAQARASVQPILFCWIPDAEFPVACEEEDEEDERSHRLSSLTPPA